MKSHYKDYGLTALPTESAYKNWEKALKEPLGQTGMETFLRKVNISLSEDTAAATNAMVAKYWPTLTDAQRKKVVQVYEKYGKNYTYGI